APSPPSPASVAPAAASMPAASAPPSPAPPTPVLPSTAPSAPAAPVPPCPAAPLSFPASPPSFPGDALQPPQPTPATPVIMPSHSAKAACRVCTLHTSVSRDRFPRMLVVTARTCEDALVTERRRLGPAVLVVLASVACSGAHEGTFDRGGAGVVPP